jgi:hypothetical protein
MARLPRTGRSFASLHERSPVTDELVQEGLDPREFKTTLRQVIARFAPRSSGDEEKIRKELGAIIGRGWEIFEDSPRLNPNALQVRDVQATLRRIAKGLDALAAGQLDALQLTAIEEVLRLENGIRQSNHIAVAVRIRRALAREIGDDVKADTLLADFRNHPKLIADACRRTAEELKSIKGESKRPALDWYPQFMRLLTDVARQNGISTSLTTVDGKAETPFADLVEAFEQLFPHFMRSPNRVVLAGRLRLRSFRSKRTVRAKRRPRTV